MKKIVTVLLLFAFYISQAQDLVLIQFTDKPSAATYLANPSLMFTQKALDRKAKFNVPIDLMDVPVEESYLTQIQNLGIEALQVSKWFNGVFAYCTETQINQAQALTFVSGVDSFVRNQPDQRPVQSANSTQEYELNEDGLAEFVYGFTETQVTQLNLDYLHNLGFTGDGLTIAVLDNGFPGVNTQGGFAYLRDNGQIKGTYDFVNQVENVYGGGTHGTVVLSTIGGYIESEFVGTAIDADFYLFITENTAHEMPDEEVNWIAAAELADYYGVDVINTSLGYSDYDDARYNYVYEDMNGETAYISRGAQIAAEKGIMVVVSAGNSGNKAWHYITAPADAVDVLTVGAVNAEGEPSSFSSFGPSSDGRIKPDVDALGSSAAVIRFDGQISLSSGTSFSSPITAGAMACLMQAFPNELPATLRQRVRESAHLYENPTDQMGYGIPDFGAAYDKILAVSDWQSSSSVLVYPNPTKDILHIQSEQNIRSLQLISMEGKIVRKYAATQELNIENLPKGAYLLKIQLENGQMETKKIIKK